MAIKGTVPDTTNRPKGKPFKVDPGLYYIRLVDVDEAQSTPEAIEKYGPSWIWRFQVVKPDMSVVMMTTEDGQTFPQSFIQFTSDKLGKNPTTNEPARARMFLEGFVGTLPKGANAQDLVNKAMDIGVANAFITVDPKKPEYMRIGQILQVTDIEVTTRVKEALDKAAPQEKPEEDDEIPF